METRNAFTGVVRFFFGRLWLISYNHDRKPQPSDSSFRFFCNSSTSWIYQRIHEGHHLSLGNGRVRCVTPCSIPESRRTHHWFDGRRGVVHMAAEKHVGLAEKKAREDSKRLQREWLRGPRENLKRTSHYKSSKSDQATTDSTRTPWPTSLILRTPILPDGPFSLTCDAMTIDRYSAGDVVF